MKKISPKKICRISLIAALYLALSVFFAPIAFGNVQMRVSEALTILPVLSPLGVPGVTIGCLLANLYGAFTGANILGFMDVFFGTTATFISAILTRLMRKTVIKGLPIVPAIPTVIINAIVVGAELSYVTTEKLFSPVFFLYALEVGLGQILSCIILGSILYKALKKANINI